MVFYFYQNIFQLTINNFSDIKNKIHLKLDFILKITYNKHTSSSNTYNFNCMLYGLNPSGKTCFFNLHFFFHYLTNSFLFKTIHNQIYSN